MRWMEKVRLLACTAGVVAIALTKANVAAVDASAVRRLPHYLTNNPLPQGFPWGLRTAQKTNTYTDYPDTGVIRQYEFTLSRHNLTPDGFERPALLINGEFPGPIIEANWGDSIQVTVHNNITGPEEGTGLHWHGLLQEGSPWQDGVTGVSQCPIAPGKTFTYLFQAQVYGTGWYHSHYSAQYSDGLFGPMVIYGPNHVDYDIDVGPILLSDWYHKPYFQQVQENLEPGMDHIGASQSNLINGRGTFNCTKAGRDTLCWNNPVHSKFYFTLGKTHRLRLINAGSEGLQRFSVDGHILTVIANDFVPLKPFDTKVVTLSVGQRMDVLIRADRGASDASFWMRANVSTICSRSEDPYARAAVYYEDADDGRNPTSMAWDVPDPGTCTNDALELTTPEFPIELPEPSWTHEMVMSAAHNSSGSLVWTFDGSSFRVNYNEPSLLMAKLGNLTFPSEANVKNLGTNSSVRLIIKNTQSSSHPIHLHGANMYVLNEGDGHWDGETIVNPSNPLRRDVHNVRGHGYIVLQFDSTNPGALLYCRLNRKERSAARQR